jgi:broad specificity phosphatase PhoE
VNEISPLAAWSAAALQEIFNAESYKQAKERVTHVLERLADAPSDETTA